MSTIKEILSTQTKAFYYKKDEILAEDTGYIVGADGYNGKKAQRIMQYKISIPQEVKVIKSIQLKFQGTDYGFGYKNSNYYNSLNGTVYCCFNEFETNLTSSNIDLSSQFSVTISKNNNGPGDWPFTNTITDQQKIKDLNLSAGDYYIYVYSTVPDYSYMFFGSYTAAAKIILEYETYTAPTPPNRITAPAIVAPNQILTVSWSGQQPGIQNNISGYELSFGTQTITTTESSCEITISGDFDNRRGESFDWKVKCIGAQSGYDSEAVVGSSRINRKPSSPNVSVNTTVVPSSGGNITYNAQVGTDQDSDYQTVQLRYQIDSGAYQNCESTGSIQIGKTVDINFYTWDGLEHSEAVTKTIVINTRPSITCSVESTDHFNLGVKVTATPAENSQNKNLTYTYQVGFYPNKNNQSEIFWKTISEANSSPVLNIADINEYIGASEEAAYKIRIKCNDGIEDSDFSTFNTHLITSLLRLEETDLGQGGKTIQVNFSSQTTDSYEYVQINNKQSKIEKTSDKKYYAIIQLEDNITDNIESKEYELFAAGSDKKFFNQRVKIKYRQVCSIQISNLILPNTTIKPFTNSGNQYSLQFLDLNKTNLSKYGLSSEKLSLQLSFNGSTASYNYDDQKWFDNTLNFTFPAETLYNVLSQYNNNSTKEITCIAQITNDYGDVYSFSKKFIADFRETPVLARSIFYPYKQGLTEDKYSQRSIDKWEYIKYDMNLYLALTFQAYTLNPEVKIIVKNINTGATVRTALLTNLNRSGELGYNNPYTYIFNGSVWEIPDILQDETLSFELEINSGLSLKESINSNIPLKAHITPQAQFTKIEYVGTNLEFEVGASGHGATLNSQKIFIHISEAETDSTLVQDQEASISNFAGEAVFNFNGYNNLHMAPIIQSTLSAKIIGTQTEEFSTTKSNEGFYVYSTVYNLLPTVSYRPNQLGINRQPNMNSSSSENDQAAAIVIGAYGEKNFIHFYGDQSKATLNLTTRQLDNFVVDCGSWGTGVDGSFDVGSIITGQLAAIAYSGDIEDLLQGDTSNPVIIISGGQA